MIVPVVDSKDMKGTTVSTVKSVPPLPADDLEHVLTHTRDLWTEARGADFFITGGTGFFGMWLLESFARINDALALGMRAPVRSRSPSAFAVKAPHLAERRDLRFVTGDVRNFEFPPGQFSYVIHAATEASAKFNEEAPHEMLDAILAGTQRVLEFASGAGVKKLLFTSSGAVYGRQPPDVSHLSEDYMGAPNPLLPGSAYGEGKRVAEHMCVVHAQRHGYEVKVARCFAFVGPHLPLDGTYAVGNFLRDALEGAPIRIAGDGTPMRSYLYASDLAVWLWRLLFRGPAARAVNVGSDRAVDIATLARVVSAALGGPSAVQIAQKPTGAPPARYVPAIARAESLGLRQTIGLEEGLQKTARWLSPGRCWADVAQPAQRA